MANLIIIPDHLEIKCEIETPQFLGSENKYYMQKQSGTFYKSSLQFVPDILSGGHGVQFNSIEDFQKALIRLL